MSFPGLHSYQKWVRAKFWGLAPIVVITEIQYERWCPFVINPLSPVHTGNKVEFNTVDFVESRQSRSCSFAPVHIGDKVDRIGNKVERIGNNFEIS